MTIEFDSESIYGDKKKKKMHKDKNKVVWR